MYVGYACNLVLMDFFQIFCFVFTESACKVTRGQTPTGGKRPSMFVKASSDHLCIVTFPCLTFQHRRRVPDAENSKLHSDYFGVIFSFKWHLI